jgi:phosphoribosylglycinamide formyltransferase 1
MRKNRLAVFVSGGGSNFQAILDSYNASVHSFEPVCLLSNTPNAGGLGRAATAGIDSRVYGNSYWGIDVNKSQEIVDWLVEMQIDMIALAGFLRMIPIQIMSAFKNRIINIHPALLPAFGGQGMYGKRVHQAVWEKGCRISGPTIHFVSSEYDQGAILLQKAVELNDDDFPDQIAAKVLQAEHQIYPEALKMLSESNYQIIAGRVTKCPLESR